MSGHSLISDTAADEYTQVAEDCLGMVGAMISGSKSTYLHEYPNNLVAFNANVCLSDGSKIWHGDLDCTKSADRLLDLSECLGRKIYVLREHDARFDNEEKPLLEKAIFTIGTGPADKTFFSGPVADFFKDMGDAVSDAFGFLRAGR